MNRSSLTGSRRRADNPAHTDKSESKKPPSSDASDGSSRDSSVSLQGGTSTRFVLPPGSRLPSESDGGSGSEPQTPRDSAASGAGSGTSSGNLGATLDVPKTLRQRVSESAANPVNWVKRSRDPRRQSAAVGSERSSASSDRASSTSAVRAKPAAPTEAQKAAIAAFVADLDFESVLKHPRLKAQMLAFMKTEYSTESFMFWQACDELVHSLRKSPSDEALCQGMEIIVGNFINVPTASVLVELNIPFGLKASVLQELATLKKEPDRGTMQLKKIMNDIVWSTLRLVGADTIRRAKNPDTPMNFYSWMCANMDDVLVTQIVDDPAKAAEDFKVAMAKGEKWPARFDVPVELPPARRDSETKVPEQESDDDYASSATVNIQSIAQKFYGKTDRLVKAKILEEEILPELRAVLSVVPDAVLNGPALLRAADTTEEQIQALEFEVEQLV